MKLKEFRKYIIFGEMNLSYIKNWSVNSVTAKGNELIIDIMIRPMVSVEFITVTVDKK